MLADEVLSSSMCMSTSIMIVELSPPRYDDAVATLFYLSSSVIYLALLWYILLNMLETLRGQIIIFFSISTSSSSDMAELHVDRYGHNTVAYVTKSRPKQHRKH